jgi:hypothetical protein
MRWESGKKAKYVTAPAGLTIFEVGVRVPHCEIRQTQLTPATGPSGCALGIDGPLISVVDPTGMEKSG